MVEQGEVIKLSGTGHLALVISNDKYNSFDAGAIVLPVVKMPVEDSLQYPFKAGDVNGYVLCDNPKKLDIGTRIHAKVGRLSTIDVLQVISLFESIFDYI